MLGISWRFAIGLTFSAVFLLLFFYRLDLGEVWQALRGADYYWLAAAVPFYFAAVYVRTARWRVLLLSLNAPGVRKLFPVVIVGYMANNLLPVRLGELARAYYLGRKTGISKASGLGTIAIERALDGLTLLLMAVAVTLVLPTLGLLRGLGESSGIPWVALALAASLPFIVAISALLAMASNPVWFQRLVLLLLRALPHRLRFKGQTLVALFVDGLAALLNPRRVLLAFGLSAAVWALETGVYLTVGFAFGLHTLFDGLGELFAVMLMVTAVSNLATALPSSQGGVGPFEFFTKGTLVFLGVGAELASAYAIVVHLTLLAPPTALGLAFLWRESLSLRQLVPRAREAATEGGGLGDLSTPGDRPA